MAIGHGQHCVIFDDIEIGEGTRIGNFVFIREKTIIGKCCVVGSYLDIEGDVRIGDFVSRQSGCYITRGVVIESEVCCGSGIITMNDKAITYHLPSLTFKRQAPAFCRLPGLAVAVSHVREYGRRECLGRSWFRSYAQCAGSNYRCG